MIADCKVADYYAGLNEPLLQAVPATARRILEVGCAEGRLGAALKEREPSRTVFGIEKNPTIAERAGRRLDAVFTLDVEAEEPPLAPGSLDCILYGDVLEHLVDPGAVLARHRPLLAPGGFVLCSVPNAQHYSLIAALVRGDFQYTSAGLLDATHLRFFTYSTFFKLLLDAGFAPQIVDTIPLPCPQPFLTAAGPLLAALGLHSGRTAHYLSAYQYIFRGDPAPAADQEGKPPAPLTFVACVSDEATLRANLLSSPCLGEDSRHELLLFTGCRSAAEGLNRGLAAARHPLVVCVHQDVYLPAGWPKRFWQQYRIAEERFGPIGVAGVYGVRRRAERTVRAGHVVDRDRLLREPGEFPEQVDTLDELLLAVPKEARLSYEPQVGFHFYGADLCLAAKRKGLAAVALDALCFHNSPHAGLPQAFYPSARAFATKWASVLPVATSCVVIEPSGRMTAS